MLLDISPPRVCRACGFSLELSDLRSPASASFLPSTLRVASRRSVMPLLDLISPSFAFSPFLFSLPFFSPFFLPLLSFFHPLSCLSLSIFASRSASLDLLRAISRYRSAIDVYDVSLPSNTPSSGLLSITSLDERDVFGLLCTRDHAYFFFFSLLTAPSS